MVNPDGLHTQEADDMWISVKERLPAWLEQVLIYAKYFDILEIAYRDEDGKWRYVYDDTEVPVVTHWMPLPMPPEAEKEEANELV